VFSGADRFSTGLCVIQAGDKTTLANLSNVQFKGGGVAFKLFQKHTLMSLSKTCG
jgi:hypothetical protein